jgi:hypothetical protein
VSTNLNNIHITDEDIIAFSDADMCTIATLKQAIEHEFFTSGNAQEALSDELSKLNLVDREVSGAIAKNLKVLYAEIEGIYSKIDLRSIFYPLANPLKFTDNPGECKDGFFGLSLQPKFSTTAVPYMPIALSVETCTPFNSQIERPISDREYNFNYRANSIRDRGLDYRPIDCTAAKIINFNSGIMELEYAIDCLNLAMEDASAIERVGKAIGKIFCKNTHSEKSKQTTRSIVEQIELDLANNGAKCKILSTEHQTWFDLEFQLAIVPYIYIDPISSHKFKHLKSNRSNSNFDDIHDLIDRDFAK